MIGLYIEIYTGIVCVNQHICMEGVQRNLSEIAHYFNFFKFFLRYGNQGRAKDIIILFWIFHGDFNVKCLSPLIAPNSVCVRGVQISIIKFKIFTLAPLYDNRCSIAADVDILKIFSRNVLVHFFRPILRECFKTDRISCAGTGKQNFSVFVSSEQK